MNKKKPVKQQPPKKVIIPQKPQRDYTVFFMLVLIAIVSIIRYRYITMPLERDEGEYAYIGNLLLHGVPPFKDGYSMKLPGTSFMYSIFMFIFGHTDRGIHLGLLFMNAVTMYLLYYAFKRLLNPFLALTTATVYGLMAIGLPFIGFAAHATHFICFYSSIAFVILNSFLKSGKSLSLFLIGLMLGMAFLMKQQAVFLILFIAVFLFIYLRKERKQTFPDIIRKFLFFGSGVAIPYIIVFLIIALTGQFHNFWLWTVKYASQYEGVKSLNIISIYFKSSFVPAWTMYNYLWIIALLGLLTLFLSSYTRLQKLFILGYTIASICMLSSGFYFRPHYYIVILPVIGLLTGIFIEYIVKQIRERTPVLKSPGDSLVLLSALVLIILYTNKDYYFNDPVGKVCDMCYWGNPFSEVPKIAKYIKEHTGDTDKIAVLGSEPEIYFYSDRKSATGYLYTYPLVDEQPYNKIMQDQMIQEIEKDKPTFIIFCNIAYSWVVQPGTPKDIFEWGNEYTHTKYTALGFIDFFNNRGWIPYWGDDIKERTTEPQSFIIIFKRNPDKPLISQ